MRDIAAWDPTSGYGIFLECLKFHSVGAWGLTSGYGIYMACHRLRYVDAWGLTSVYCIYIVCWSLRSVEAWGLTSGYSIFSEHICIQQHDLQTQSSCRRLEALANNHNTTTTTTFMILAGPTYACSVHACLSRVILVCMYRSASLSDQLGTHSGQFFCLHACLSSVILVCVYHSATQSDQLVLCDLFRPILPFLC